MSGKHCITFKKGNLLQHFLYYLSHLYILSLAFSVLSLNSAAQDNVKGTKIVENYRNEQKSKPAFHALIIANSDYQFWNKLPETVSESRMLGKILAEKYGFAVDTCFNKNFSYIFKTLKHIIISMKNEDNLLIVYSGHGKEDGGQYYWVPVEGTKDDESNYINNDELSGWLGNCNAHHVLLISDACKSENLVRGDNDSEAVAVNKRMDNGKPYNSQKEFMLCSRQWVAVTGFEDAPAKSIFSNALCKELEMNAKSCINWDDLFYDIRGIMKNQTEFKPRYGAFKNMAKEEGGQFYFLLSSNQVSSPDKELPASVDYKNVNNRNDSLLYNANTISYKNKNEGNSISKESVQGYINSANSGNVSAMDSLGLYYSEGRENIGKDSALALKWFQQAANRNDVYAEIMTGKFYEYGGGTVIDFISAKQWYSKAAEKGYAPGQYNLGNLYYFGNGVSRDYNKAMTWYLKAADQDYAPAQNSMGNLYYWGLYVFMDYPKAYEWYKKAALEGYAPAEFNLGVMYEYGRGDLRHDYNTAIYWVKKAADQDYPPAQFCLGILTPDKTVVNIAYPEELDWFKEAIDKGDATSQYKIGNLYSRIKDYTMAMEWYNKAAIQGNDSAQCKIGYLYYKGYGVKQNNVIALEWLTKAANKDNAEAKYYLGNMYYEDVGIAKDYIRAMDWYGKSAEQGYAPAQIGIGNLYKYGLGVKQDYSVARKWYKKAANQDNADAEYEIANLYLYGGTGLPSDYSLALEWYKNAAEHNNAASESKIGYLYQSGFGVNRDYAMAKQWYEKAAVHGNAEGQYRLGVMYEVGMGIIRDYSKAMEWYSKAADQSYSPAQFNIGKLFEYGYGMKKDYPAALEWYKKAADQGNADAQYEIGELYERGFPGTEPDWGKAKEWYVKAAGNGNLEAKEKLRDKGN